MYFWGEKDGKIQLLLLQPLFIFIMQSSGAMLYALQLLEDRTKIFTHPSPLQTYKLIKI